MNKFSRVITKPKSQGASQAMLYAAGLTDNDMQKPQIAIASNWFEGNPCNMHLNQLAGTIKDSFISDGRLNALRMTTISISDGISMSTSGMSHSLPSREIIADSIECVMKGMWYDGLVCVPACDKNMPGALIAMCRVNRPSMAVYGGTIKKGCLNGQSLDVVSAFQSYGEFLSGRISDKQRQEIVANSCPGGGSCGGMYTANTMSSAIEAMGLSLPFSASSPALSEDKVKECSQVATTMHNLLELDLKPRDILTKRSFENAVRVVVALGGSTNAVLHLVAVAHAAKIDFTIDDFQRLSQNTPYIADLKPSGQFMMEDLHAVGGVPAVMKYMLQEGLLHGDEMTITGRSLAENLEDIPSLPTPSATTVIRPLSQPLKKTGHICILKGNLAPLGSVAKITGKEGTSFSGVARCFDSEKDMLKALEFGSSEELSDQVLEPGAEPTKPATKGIQKGDVVIIRYVGPKGGPGMPEMLAPSSAIVGKGLSKDVALLTDGRFSGGSHGFIIGHVTPEAYDGGPIALVQDGDKITINAETMSIQVDVSDEELAKRRSTWKLHKTLPQDGLLRKYVKLVSDPSKGCVTDL